MGVTTIGKGAFGDWGKSNSTSLAFTQYLSTIGESAFINWSTMQQGIGFSTTYTTGPNTGTVEGDMIKYHPEIYISPSTAFSVTPTIGTTIWGWGGIDSSAPSGSQGPYWFVGVVTSFVGGDMLVTPIDTNMNTSYEPIFNINSMAYNVVSRSSTITSIGASAFQTWLLAHNPATLVFPSSLTSIGNDAFNGWRANPWGIDISNTQLTTIGSSTFKDWVSANGSQELALPSNVTSIGEDAFRSWSVFGYGVALNNGLKTIGKFAFGSWAWAHEEETYTYPISSWIDDTNNVDITASTNSTGVNGTQTAPIKVYYADGRLTKLTLPFWGLQIKSKQFKTNQWIWYATAMIADIENEIIELLVSKGFSVGESERMISSIMAYDVDDDYIRYSRNEDPENGNYLFTDDASIRNNPSWWKGYRFRVWSDDSIAFDVSWATDDRIQEDKWVGTVGVINAERADLDSGVNPPGYPTDYAATNGGYTPTYKDRTTIPGTPQSREYGKPLRFPNSVTSIGDYAFTGWERWGGLPVFYNTSITSIGRNAFAGWDDARSTQWGNQTGLTHLTFPSSLTSVGTYAFYNGFDREDYIEFLGTTIPTVGKWAFSIRPEPEVVDNDHDLIAIVPDGADKAAWATALWANTYWSNIGSVIWKSDSPF